MSQEDYNLSVCYSTSLLATLSFHSHQAIFKVAPESGWLIALHLPVLDWTPAQVLIQLGDIDGCRTLLILRGWVSYPVVDVRCLSWALVLTYLVVRIKKQKQQSDAGSHLHTSYKHA